MVLFWNIIKAIFLGIVEGITEWLPISSTGHLILADEFVKMEASAEFMEMFNVVIQFGAIIAVIILFWKKLWPFQNNQQGTTFIEKYCREDVWVMWFHVIVAILPSAIIGLPLDDWMTEHLHTPVVIAITLILYGVLFIWMENTLGNKRPQVKRIYQINYRMAAFIGVFQLLSLIPGTSRSGATILGAMILGCSRTVAAEFTFFMAVPTMAGASLVKLIKFLTAEEALVAAEFILLLVGMAVAFVVSMFCISFLMNYVKKHDFKVFGWYRIGLGIVVLLYFVVIKGWLAAPAAV